MKCRICESKLEKVFIDLGKSPLSNSFLSHEDLDKKEPVYPLKVFVCEKCFLVQLPEFEKPDKIFTNYAYFSSYSETWLQHMKDFVKKIIIRLKLDQNSYVIEIASNDGYLLQYFKKSKISVLGVEPAKNVAKVAIKKNIPTLVKFFNHDTANELKKKRQPDLIIGNNVLAHVPNVNDFVKSMKILLGEKGVITMEFPHLLQLIKKNQFDTIYHEHFSYFSFFTVKILFEKHGLKIFDVEEIPTHGGSLRIYACHSTNSDKKTTKNVEKIIKKEKKFSINSINSYASFSKNVNQIKNELIDFLHSSKNDKKTVIAYGAAAKGNTLLNYCNVTTDMIKFVVDKNKYKQGLFLPGTHIPIKSPQFIQKTKPDYLLILPWNIKEEIMEQMDLIRNWGGRFVVAIPKLKVYQ